MKNDTSHFVVRLTDDNFGSKTKRKYITGTCDAVSDVAFALGYSTLEDCLDYNLEYIRHAVEHIIDSYDWESYVRKQLDNEPECIALAQGQDEFLPGDYYDINHHEKFMADVKKCRETVTDELLEVYPFNEDADAPKELIEALRDGVDKCYDECTDEWSTDITRAIAKYFDLPSRSVFRDEYSNLVMDFTEEEAREWLGYNVQEDEPVTTEILTDNVVSHLLDKAEGIILVKERRSKERLEAQKERQKREDAAMEAKKQAARERKTLAQK